MKECPFCAEIIEDSLTQCPFCKNIQKISNKENLRTENKQITDKATFYEPSFPWKPVSILSLILCILNIMIGFYKMFIYENHSWSQKNAYVGGDAFNYIINSNYAVGYFTLATIFAIFSIGCIVIYYLDIIANKE